MVSASVLELPHSLWWLLALLDDVEAEMACLLAL